eukprot:365195-Chlamydomonas_euryale.AAC.6
MGAIGAFTAPRLCACLRADGVWHSTCWAVRFGTHPANTACMSRFGKVCAWAHMDACARTLSHDRACACRACGTILTRMHAQVATVCAKHFGSRTWQRRHIHGRPQPAGTNRINPGPPYPTKPAPTHPSNPAPPYLSKLAPSHPTNPARPYPSKVAPTNQITCPCMFRPILPGLACCMCVRLMHTTGSPDTILSGGRRHATVRTASVSRTARRGAGPPSGTARAERLEVRAMVRPLLQSTPSRVTPFPRAQHLQSALRS